MTESKTESLTADGIAALRGLLALLDKAVRAEFADRDHDFDEIQIASFIFYVQKQVEHAAPALLAAAEAQTWRPMESAPKDGTWFLGWETHYKYPMLAHWKSGDWRWEGQEYSLLHTNSYSGYPATHWLPLPLPPAAPPQET